jgi:hypothetical protein
MLNRAGTQNSYSCQVRIGNWSEDKELKELHTKEYLRKKENGELLVSKVRGLLNESLQEVPLSYSKDGYVHIGDHIMLYSVETQGVVSVDLSTKIQSSDEGYAVTTSKLTKAPVARNVFVIEPYGPGQKEGDVLRLGQKFRLRTMRNLYLHSQPVSTMSSSKSSNNQEVAAVPSNQTHDTVWVAQYKDTNQRFEMEGSEVPGNAEIIIQHAATKSALASQNLDFYNDFGKECELCCNSYISIKKKQFLSQEKQGLCTADIPVRSEAIKNHFAFLTASVPELDPNAQSAPAEAGAPAGAGEASF